MRPLDVAALGALAAVGLGLARGGLSAGAASGGNATLLLLLPGLICFVAAVAAGRLLGPVMRRSERLARNGPLPARLALLALARAPSRTVATAAFLLVSLGLALFAAGYRSTLEQGARDEAAYVVPLDFTLSEGSRLVLPLDAAPPAAYARLAPGTHVYPVIRRTASVPGSGAAVLSPTVLGLSATALARLHWRSDFSSVSPGDAGAPPRRRRACAAARRCRSRPERRACRCPSESVASPSGSTSRPRTLSIASCCFRWARRGQARGSSAQRFPPGCGRSSGSRSRSPTPRRTSCSIARRKGSWRRRPPARSRSARSRPGAQVLTAWHGWLALGGAALAGRTVSYSFTSDLTMLLRLPQATDSRPLRVIVSPAIAQGAGTGRLAHAGVSAGAGAGADRRRRDAVPRRAGVRRRVRDRRREPSRHRPRRESARHRNAGRVVAVGSRRRGVARRERAAQAAVRGSRSRVARATSSARSPAIRSPAGRRSPSASPRSSRCCSPRSAFWLALVNELNDERGELFDLEAQGVAPAVLRMQFRLRAIVLVDAGRAGRRRSRGRPVAARRLARAHLGSDRRTRASAAVRPALAPRRPRARRARARGGGGRRARDPARLPRRDARASVVEPRMSARSPRQRRVSHLRLRRRRHGRAAGPDARGRGGRDRRRLRPERLGEVDADARRCRGSSPCRPGRPACSAPRSRESARLPPPPFARGTSGCSTSTTPARSRPT